MTLRLVLISLVAGLGLGLPSWPTIEGWVAGAQKWMNARLAAADNREGDRHVVIHDLLAAEMKRAHASRQARRAPAAPALAPRPAFIAVAHTTAPRRPAAVATPAASSLPIPLPKLDDYLSAASVPAAPTLAVARPDDLALLAWGRIRPEAARLAEALAEGLREAAGRDGDARAFVAMEGSGELYFDAAVPAEPAPIPAEAVAAVEGPEPLAIEGPAPEAVAFEATPLPDFDAMERSADLYFAAPIVDESAPAPEAMLAEIPEPAAIEAEASIGLAELPTDVFAPIEAAPVAVAVAVAAPESAPASPEVNRAVRLTREALSAWINVLTGPALVTASHGVAIAR